jgi:aminoglycoside phosphotransferase (APT) family kinase protein
MTRPARVADMPVGGTNVLDEARLDAYLRARVAGLAGRLRVDPVAGGQSNPTFFITYDNRRLVLRKQPQGEHLPSAHAVDREYRVMTALAGSGVPVPRTLFLEEDPAIIGTSFFVMERIDGRVIHDSALPGLTPDQRKSIYDHKADTLAALHRVDWKSVGLDGFGRPGNYFARQVSRWSRQWELSRTRDIPEIETLVGWLPRNIPADEITTIVHGDYRMGNLILSPDATRIAGVLDWELSTLGHPLADVAHAVSLWFIRPEEYGGLMGLELAGTGIPGWRGFEELCIESAGLARGLQPFHLAFALFRMAVIFEGIAGRARSGTAAAANAAQVGALSQIFARRAAGLLSSDRLRGVGR